MKNKILLATLIGASLLSINSFAYKIISQEIKITGTAAAGIRTATPEDLANIYKQKKNINGLQMPNYEGAMADVKDFIIHCKVPTVLSDYHGVFIKNVNNINKVYTYEYVLDVKGTDAKIDVKNKVELTPQEKFEDQTALYLTFQPFDFNLYTLESYTYLNGDRPVSDFASSNITIVP
jgi:hypothetical protein